MCVLLVGDWQQCLAMHIVKHPFLPPLVTDLPFGLPGVLIGIVETSSAERKNE